MNREYVRPFTIWVEHKVASCNKCGCGKWFYEGANPVLGTSEKYFPEFEKLLGTSCSCGGTYELDSSPISYRDGGYWKVECKCGVTLSIYRDGQQCNECNQMYNGVGQPITHRGYDAYGDIDEY